MLKSSKGCGPLSQAGWQVGYAPEADSGYGNKTDDMDRMAIKEDAGHLRRRNCDSQVGHNRSSEPYYEFLFSLVLGRGTILSEPQ